MKENIFLVNYNYQGFQSIDIEVAKQNLKKLAIASPLVVDSESTGFYPANSELLFLQIGNADIQYIIFPKDLLEFKEILEGSSLIFHGAKHDLKFLLSYKIVPRNIYCTHLQELVLECGKNKLGIALKKASLASIAKKYLDITLDKSQRKNLKYDKESFIYGARDIIYLHELHKIQSLRLDTLSLTKAIDLENRFVIVLAYTENNGFLLDQEGWILKCQRDDIVYQESTEKLQELIKQDDRVNSFISISSDLFSAPKEILDINLDSPKQALTLIKALGIDLNIQGKDTLEGKHLIKYKEKEPIIKEYLINRKAAKKLSTYGYNILEAANNFSDGRLRTDYKQVITTSRMSSASNNERKEGVNLQNFPKNSIERRYFKADKENKLIIADYKGQETRILAQFAKDPAYTEFIINPEKDLHCFLLQCIYPEIYSQYSHPEIEKKFSKERSWVKPGTFSMPYGGNGKTIADNLGIPIELGEAAYKRFMDAFPGLGNYYKQVEKAALLNGYILINSIFNRKVFSHGYENYKKLCAIKYLSKEQFKLKKQYESSFARLARNYPIQASAAEMVKLAGIYYFNWLIKNNYLDIIKIIGFIHDEIILEVPENLIDIAKNKLELAMVKAGKYICPDIPILVDIRVSNIWLQEKT